MNNFREEFHLCSLCKHYAVNQMEREHYDGLYSRRREYGVMDRVGIVRDPEPYTMVRFESLCLNYCHFEPIDNMYTVLQKALPSLVEQLRSLPPHKIGDLIL